MSNRKYKNWIRIVGTTFNQDFYCGQDLQPSKGLGALECRGYAFLNLTSFSFFRSYFLFLSFMSKWVNYIDIFFKIEFGFSLLGTNAFRTHSLAVYQGTSLRSWFQKSVHTRRFAAYWDTLLRSWFQKSASFLLGFRFFFEKIPQILKLEVGFFST